MARIGIEIAKGCKTMETKNVQKANKVLYMVIVAVLCVTAIVIGITAAANRGSKTPISTTEPPAVTTAPPVTTPPVTEPPVDQPTQPSAGQLPTFVAPAVGVVSKQHDLSVPVYSLTMNDWRVHNGIDIACQLGDEVLAAADGTVTSIVSDPMMGTTVTLSHSGESETIYKNLAVTLPEGIEVGKTVKAGEIIGAVGDTSLIEGADEAHLHFEMKVKGQSVDPMAHISKESQEASFSFDTDYES